MTEKADLLAAVADDIFHHPRFGDPVLHYTQALLSWRNDERLVNKISSTHARSQIVGYLMLLHFEAARDAATVGATYTNLWRLCERRKDCSPRVLKTVLAVLRVARMVTLTRAKSDKRLHVYQPTQRLIGFVQDWYSRTFGCFDIMNGKNFAARMRSEPNLLAEVIVAIGRPYIDHDIILVRQYPEIFHLFLIDLGFVAAASLTATHLRGEPPLSAHQIAKKYGSSPSQARNVLKWMRENDLIVCDDAGQVVDRAKIALLFQLHVARELSLYAKYALGLSGYFAFMRCRAAKAEMTCSVTEGEPPISTTARLGHSRSPDEPIPV
ncbi:hypothetical protein [Methylovirgula sp. HY1]|uniref:hypothetical protein n=1 Tax=Methylovirgula sp. HY1 TaxID=2822761 RepID=UPI001C5BD5AE|nr:hypothetical protein [Methylovirgula sp. HY1]